MYASSRLRARARAHVRMASARFDEQKLIAYAHRPEDVSGHRCRSSRTSERASARCERGAEEAFSSGLPSGLHAGPETVFNVYIRVAPALL